MEKVRRSEGVGRAGAWVCESVRLRLARVVVMCLKQFIAYAINRKYFNNVSTYTVKRARAPKGTRVSISSFL